ncbi:MAG TPA: TadE family protein [Bryobacteraceae bacterium]|nr:TadE family protein [Bryobacteraceae bacterium]
MKRRNLRGVSTIEFALSLVVLVPLILGTGALGINLIKNMQTIQLARDAGHMFARGVDFSQTGNQNMLATLGTSLGLQTSGSGNAVVILSALTYVDANTCVAGGAATNGVPNSSCTNLNKWVFVQRLEIGNTSLRTSNYGAPITNGSDISNNVTLDSQGKISVAQYATRTGAVAQFSSANGINPYSVVNNVAQGLPSGQRLYLAEAASTGFRMPPYVAGVPNYSFAFF